MSAEKNKKSKRKIEKEQYLPISPRSENIVPAHFYSAGNISLKAKAGKNVIESDESVSTKPEKKSKQLLNSKKSAIDLKGFADVRDNDAVAAAPPKRSVCTGAREAAERRASAYSKIRTENDALLSSLKAENIKVSAAYADEKKDRAAFAAGLARYAAMTVLVLIMAASVINIVLDVYAKSKAASLYENIRDMFYSDEVTYLNAGYLAKDSGSVPEERLYSDEGDIYKAPELEILDTHEKYLRMLPNLEALKQINSSAFAWIKVEGTRVDYPVVRSPQGDNDYYLSHAIDRTFSNSGSVFMDYSNSTNLSNNRNTCIYGHNMNDGTMFQTIMNFRTRNQFLNGHIELYTSGGIYLYTPFSVYDAAPTESFFKTSFENDAEFEEFLKDIKSKSLFSSGTSVGTGDKVVTLITCTNTAIDKRFVVHGVLTEIAK